MDKVDAQIHRFRDWVAVYIGTGETVYLSPGDARRFAIAMLDCTGDCEAHGFAGSKFRSTSFEFDNRPK